MAPFLNDKFPNLIGSTQDTDNFDLYEYLDKKNNKNDRSCYWSIIFMHPGDYTPVCTTELGEASILDHEFRNRGVKIVGFSCSPKESHAGWIRDIKHVAGIAPRFPIFSDPDRKYASQLGMLDRSNVDRKTGMPLTFRGVYILDPNKIIRLMTAYPASTGRNMDEILRSLDSLLLAERRRGTIATPCNWKPGDDVLVDYSLTDREADETFGKEGYRTVDLPSETTREQQQRNGDGDDNGSGKEESKHYMRYVRDASSSQLSR